ncbi:MAG: hypothetical protein WA441_11515 [Methyloceanibacter sp.]
MTWFLRNAFLALVAFAALAIIVMMAVSSEAKDLKPSTNPADAVTGADAKSLVAPVAPRNAADRTRQIVVSSTTSKTQGETIKIAKGDDAAEPARPAEAKPMAAATLPRSHSKVPARARG